MPGIPINSITPLIGELDSSLECPVCSESFKSSALKFHHQRSKHHFPCFICDARFDNEAAVVYHILQDHNVNQELKCPGCERIFRGAGAWMLHIENHECPRISPEAINARQKKSEQFTESLAGLKNELNLENVDPTMFKDTWFNDPILDTLDGHDNLEPHQGTTVDQVYKKPGDFPRLGTQEYHSGGQKELDLLSGDVRGPKLSQPAPVWPHQRKLGSKPQGPASSAKASPGTTKLVTKPQEWNSWAEVTSAGAPQPALAARPFAGRQGPAPAWDHNAKIQVVKPSASTPATANTQVGMSQAVPSTNEYITDPNHPNFNAARFYNSILEQFKCPHSRCGKKFNTAGGLISHLKSAAHRSEEQYSCPSCFRKFNSKASLVQHIETTVAKCGIRTSSDFRSVVTELTGGILDVEHTKDNDDPLDGVADPQKLLRDMGRIVLGDRAISEFAVSPPKHVPGSEKREDLQGEKKKNYQGWGDEKKRNDKPRDSSWW